MKSPRQAVIGALLLAGACTSNDPTPTVPLDQVPGHDTMQQDTSHKESPRLVPAEAYLQTYLKIFGGTTALQSQTQLSAGGTGLFDNWNAYLGALGLPNYALDLPRTGQTNALMIATFERLGIALCDKAVEKDIKATPSLPLDKRMVYTFDVPKDPVDLATFTTNFDMLHRTFLGYPAKLAPTDRVNRFYTLYKDAIAKLDPKASRFLPTEAGWAAVCYGLVRHPEFHLY